MTRLLPVAHPGAALRELLPALHRLADALDPAGTATQAWGPREVCPDRVPDALLVDQR